MHGYLRSSALPTLQLRPPLAHKNSAACTAPRVQSTGAGLAAPQVLVACAVALRLFAWRCRVWRVCPPVSRRSATVLGTVRALRQAQAHQELLERLSPSFNGAAAAAAPTACACCCDLAQHAECSTHAAGCGSLNSCCKACSAPQQLWRHIHWLVVLLAPDVGAVRARPAEIGRAHV